MVTNKRLNRKVNYCILKLYHFKFKQHLKAKNKQY